MNKIQTGLIALSFSSMALASGVLPPPAMNYFDGFYAGIGAGVAHTNAKVESLIVDTVTVKEGRPFYNRGEVTEIANYGLGFCAENLGKNNGAGDLFVGYGQTFDSTYLGIELFGQYTPTKMKASAAAVQLFQADIDSNKHDLPVVGEVLSNTDVQIKNDWTLGADIRLGYLVSPRTMIYLLAGADWAQYKVNVRHDFLVRELDDNNKKLELRDIVNKSYCYDHDKWRTAFMPGVGIETMLTDNLSLRAQYTYYWYSNLTEDRAVPEEKIKLGNKYRRCEGLFYSSLAHSEVKPSRGLFMVDLSWYFKNM